ncbi:Uncharacterised protein [Delftia tsuruhatensis]|uniref:hypothetical protein n=1 Tax=Delftia tsuruhatensis TaxID=180282 RepID=UPI001E72585D|nr:hypothetical protein [Delftia tsuruhatensis]CAB5721502.1 Uncharacterised protein [Delftia tsuruhatensis]CAC9681649.1 Uncharacterised protein [Delftia tsuruhatensis]
MTDSTPLTAAQLRTLAEQAAAQPRCADCTALSRPAWESVSGATAIAQLDPVGPLGTPDMAHRLAEFHPQATHLWSPDAPIAVGWHPYNQSTLWRCRNCAGLFLRYTEYGGYYQDERIRPLRAELIVEPQYHE